MPRPKKKSRAEKFKVKFLDLRIEDDTERRSVLDAIDTVLQHGQFILGPEVDAFEAAAARYCERRFAVGVGSGTDAIILALKAHNIGPGDEVVTSAISWLASGTAIAQTGAEPIFADIEDDLNISVASVQECITPKTRAIMPVHYGGKICDMPALRACADEAGLVLIEDASQSFGARRNGRPSGAESDIAVFSLNPMKLLPAIGEAGLILCDDPVIDGELRSRRYHGLISRSTTDKLSPNARLDTVQAAILLTRLDTVDSIISRRAALAAKYQRALSNYVTVPRESDSPDSRDSWFVYAIRTAMRDELYQFLRARGVEAMIRDHIVLPDQPVFSHQNPTNTVNARRAANDLICLPLYENLSNDDADFVIQSVIAFFDGERI